SQCTLGDQCVGGVCQPGPNAPDGAACYDGSICTGPDTCTAGVCHGDPIVCPGVADGCHPGPTCDEMHGCVNPPFANGTPCDDGDRCPADGRCTVGVCSGTPIDACHIDEYACYRATGGRPVTQTVALADRLGSSDMVLGRATVGCNPATDGTPFE